MLQSFLTPTGIGFILTIVVGLLGLWGFKYFEPRKPPETLEQAEAKRKAEEDWFRQQWNLAVLENTKNREDEIHKACAAEFVKHAEYRRDMECLKGSIETVQTKLTQHSSDIEHMKTDIKRTADASEDTNKLLRELGSVIASIDGSWKTWYKIHGPLNGGN